jgi:hypothetical protein
MALMVERRRTPRVELNADESLRLELRHRVQLLDISQTGALVGCDAAIPIGTRGQLRAGIGAQTFSAEIDVKRHHSTPPVRTQFGIGTAFGNMDDRNRTFLDAFLPRVRD